MISPGKNLRQLLRRGPVHMPGAFDALSALLIEQSGFESIYLTGAGLSVSYLGKPDIGLLTLDEVAGTARRICEVVKLPMIVDADTGFGGVSNVARAVREIESAGAAGIQIEDQVFPKRCGHLSGKSVVSAERMIEKIRAATTARRDKNFVVVARTDARGVTNFQDALQRAQAYKKAGADIIFPEALQSASEFRAFGRKKSLGTLMANMTEFGLSPALTVSDLTLLGFRLILAPMTAFRVAAFAMKEGLKTLRRQGHSRSLLRIMQTRSELYELNHYADYNQREEKLLSQQRRHRKK